MHTYRYRITLETLWEKLYFKANNRNRAYCYDCEEKH